MCLTPSLRSWDQGLSFTWGEARSDHRKLFLVLLTCICSHSINIFSNQHFAWAWYSSSQMHRIPWLLWKTSTYMVEVSSRTRRTTHKGTQRISRSPFKLCYLRVSLQLDTRKYFSHLLFSSLPAHDLVSPARCFLCVLPFSYSSIRFSENSIRMLLPT